MKEKGSFEIWRSDNVLSASVTGLWNGSVAARYRSEFIKHASMLLHDRWAHIVYLDNWVLGTPEIEPIIKDLAHWCNNNNLACSAHVYSRNMLKEYQLNKMLVSESNKFELRHFYSIEEAIDWLHDEEFEVRYPELEVARRFA
tara:strand:- start:293 stop:721 length:429 start_codon:yes stop_codon:yes gene_type:complete